MGEADSAVYPHRCRPRRRGGGTAEQDSPRTASGLDTAEGTAGRVGSEGGEEEEAMVEIGSAVYPHQSPVEAMTRGSTVGVGGCYAI